MMNKGVGICCKSVTANLITVVDIIIEPSIAIEKPMCSLEKIFLLGNLSSCIIPPSLPIFFFYSSIMRTNSTTHQIKGLILSSVDS